MTETQQINAICTEIMRTNSPYRDYLKKIPAQYRDDLLQEVLCIILEKPAKLIQAAEGKWLRYYFVNICQKQFFSGTSPFFKKYKNKYAEYVDTYHDDIDEDDDLICKLLLEDKWSLVEYAKANTKLTWYESRIASQYWDDNLSMAKIGELNDTSTGYIFNTIHKILGKYRETIAEMPVNN